MFFKNKYINQLETRISVLEKSLADEKRYSQELIERLLAKNGVPQVAKEIPQAAVEGLLRTADIFEDVDGGEEIEDNRREHVDAFAS